MADYGYLSLSNASQLERSFGHACSEPAAASHTEQLTASQPKESAASQPEESATSQTADNGKRRIAESNSGTSLGIKALSCMVLLLGVGWSVLWLGP